MRCLIACTAILWASMMPSALLADGVGPVSRIALAGGVTLLVQPDPTVETVAICCFVRAGAAEEEGISGLGALAARALFGSNDSQSREAVDREIYLAGGSLETSWHPDYTLITCVTDRLTFKDALYSIAQALKSAQFDHETVETSRVDLIAEAKAADADPARAAASLARSRLYTGGPYRSPETGAPDKLRQVRTSTLQSYHRKRFTPSVTVISVVGNVTVEEVERSAENHLIDYDRPAGRPAYVLPSGEAQGPVTLHRQLATSTRTLVAAFRGPGVADPDYPAWLVLNAIVGGGKSSRLFRQVRDGAGVGYSVMSQVATFAKDGNLMALVEYDPSRMGHDGKPIDPVRVIGMMLDAVRSITNDPADTGEISRAKRFVSGRLALAHERVRDRAFYIGWYEAIGAGHAFDVELPKRIAEVKPEDVLRLARKWLKNEVVVNVGPLTRGVVARP